MPFSPEVLDKSEPLLNSAFSNHPLISDPERGYSFLVIMTPVIEQMQSGIEKLRPKVPSWVIYKYDNPDFEKLLAETRKSFFLQWNLRRGNLNKVDKRLSLIYEALRKNRPVEAPVNCKIK